MEELRVESFLSIKKAVIEIKPFVIIIGPQASGKSVLAKLVYYMKRTFSTDMIQFIQNNEPLSAFEKAMKKNFKKIFPEYTWHSSVFSIEYICGSKHVKISNIKKRKFVFEITYSDNIKTFYTEFKSISNQKWKEAQKKQDNDEEYLPDSMRKDQIFRQLLTTLSKKYSEIEPFIENSLFIPAGRSFFSTLKQNIFRFISESVEIDPFLKEFGAAFETVKNRYHRVPAFLRKDFKQYDLLVSEILCGQYEHTKEDDWISKGQLRVKLANSSSGQQEALPMLLVLTYYPFMQRNLLKNTYFIEEPEAHLFPSSQKKIIELIALIHNITKRNNNFFITTHSPYVISALNNLVVADNAIKLSKSGPIIDKLVNKTIAAASLSAYVVDKGNYKSIVDQESMMLNASYIDAVSNEFASELDELLRITYGN